MDTIWYPQQDVDFLGRLSRLEKTIERIERHLFGKEISKTLDESETENQELRIRLDSLEEHFLILSEELGKLEEEVKSKDY